MKKILRFLVVLIICINVSLGFAQDSAEKDKLYVKLTFDANEEDTGLKNQTKSYITKRLRQLGDILFTDYKHKFELSFFIFEAKTKKGQRTGIVIISVIVKKPLPDGKLLFIGDTFKACNRQDLRETCELLVTQLNEELIKKNRQMY